MPRVGRAQGCGVLRATARFCAGRRNGLPFLRNCRMWWSLIQLRLLYSIVPFSSACLPIFFALLLSTAPYLACLEVDDQVEMLAAHQVTEASEESLREALLLLFRGFINNDNASG